MATKTRLTLQEFLAMPEEKPYREFVDGEVVEKTMPTEGHAELANRLGRLWEELAERAGIRIRVGPEMRYMLAVGTRSERVFLPDLSVRRRSSPRQLGTAPISDPPDIAVEILSPEDRPARVAEKTQFYMQSGITEWLIDPDSQSLTVFTPGLSAVEYSRGALIPCGPVFPDGTIDSNRLFEVLDD